MWHAAGKYIAPGADSTIKRPIVGKLVRFLGPELIPISRKRDDTWRYFIDRVKEDSVVIILPEGRMKRPTGLDKHGNPMTVRGGVADILAKMKHGKMLILYSGGLHHVSVPGQKFPNLFKTITCKTEVLDIEKYIEEMHAAPTPDFRQAVIEDLQGRLEEHCYGGQRLRPEPAPLRQNQG